MSGDDNLEKVIYAIEGRHHKLYFRGREAIVRRYNAKKNNLPSKGEYKTSKINYK